MSVFVTVIFLAGFNSSNYYGSLGPVNDVPHEKPALPFPDVFSAFTGFLCSRPGPIFQSG
jgi:hypothetical protein